tara:strand:- start:790 stop:972 length:183 start_codon:yes stop_codon:yes gene_type:complete
MTTDSTNADQNNIDALIKEFDRGLTDTFPEAAIETTQIFRTSSVIPTAPPTVTLFLLNWT